ncbi:MAG: hypothetical protein ACI4UE_05455 [Candidatus Scatovivens sp.]
MLEEALLKLLTFSLFLNIAFAIISFLLMMNLIIITYKEIHNSANQ